MCGASKKGQLGVGPCEAVVYEVVLVIERQVNKVACGENHTMILLDDGSVQTTGSNDRYQLG